MDPTTETALTSAATPITRPSPTETQDEIDVDAIVLRNDLRLYLREAWHVVEPSTVYLENSLRPFHRRRTDRVHTIDRRDKPTVAQSGPRSRIGRRFQRNRGHG